MSNILCIKPFPENINRQHFASWLSGFVDGEGSFILSFCRTIPQCRFSIGLRAYDSYALELIQSFLQCGRLNLGRHLNKAHAPQLNFSVRSNYDLVKYVIPHFDAYPLFAKKSRDYDIWRSAVLMCNVVLTRSQKTPGRLNRFAIRWSEDLLQTFAEYAEILQCTRDYRGPEW